VHFDGPHMTKDVITEAVWFANTDQPQAQDLYLMTILNTTKALIISKRLAHYGFKAHRRRQE
jgi:hypothetical protein